MLFSCRSVHTFLIKIILIGTWTAAFRFATASVTELPMDFDDAVNRAVLSSLEGLKLLPKSRIEFDTSGGDRTYSSLHNSLPFVKSYLKLLSDGMNISVYANSSDCDEARKVRDEMKLVRVFFPDMGAAASIRSQWRLGDSESSLPRNIIASSILDEGIGPNDCLIVVVCPLYSEADALRGLLSRCSDTKVPCILINPNLLNPDQGYGTRAKATQRDLIDSAPLVYQLKSLSVGALTYEYGRSYSLWLQDTNEEIGFSLFKAFESSPSSQDITEMIQEVEAKKGGTGGKAVVKSLMEGISQFMSQLKRL